MKTHNENPERIEQLTDLSNVIGFIVTWLGKDGEHNSFAQVVAMMHDYSTQIKLSHDRSTNKLFRANANITEEKNRLHKLVCNYEEQIRSEKRQIKRKEKRKSYDKTLGIICSYDEQIYNIKDAKDRLDLKSEELGEKIEEIKEARDKQRRLARMQEEMEEPGK